MLLFAFLLVNLFGRDSVFILCFICLTSLAYDASIRLTVICATMSDDASSVEKKSITNSSATVSTAASFPPVASMEHYKKTYDNIRAMDLNTLEGTSFSIPQSEDSHLNEVSCYDACCNFIILFLPKDVNLSSLLDCDQGR